MGDDLKARVLQVQSLVAESATSTRVRDEGRYSQRCELLAKALAILGSDAPSQHQVANVQASVLAVVLQLCHHTQQLPLELPGDYGALHPDVSMDIVQQPGGIICPQVTVHSACMGHAVMLHACSRTRPLSTATHAAGLCSCHGHLLPS
jgi:hypothetical protein